MQNFHLLWDKITTNLGPNEIEQIAITMRYIWYRRNIAFFQNNITSPNHTRLVATQEHKEFLSANQRFIDTVMTMNLPKPRMRWMAPKVNSVNVNWDASVLEKNQKMGIDIILRDCNGELLACLSSLKPFYSQPIVAEFWSLDGSRIVSTFTSIIGLMVKGKFS